MNKPKAFCINLDRKPDQWNRIKNDWSDTLDLERFSAFDGQKLNITGQQALINTTKRLIISYSTKY